MFLKYLKPNFAANEKCFDCEKSENGRTVDVCGIGMPGADSIEGQSA